MPRKLDKVSPGTKGFPGKMTGREREKAQQIRTGLKIVKAKGAKNNKSQGEFQGCP